MALPDSERAAIVALRERMLREIAPALTTTVRDAAQVAARVFTLRDLGATPAARYVAQSAKAVAAAEAPSLDC